jgi:hypothetical protein
MDLRSLPRLGVGISAEYESARRGIDALALREQEPGIVDFLEFGATWPAGSTTTREGGPAST